jgi:hypothetical protein
MCLAASPFFWRGEKFMHFYIIILRPRKQEVRWGFKPFLGKFFAVMTGAMPT